MFLAQRQASPELTRDGRVAFFKHLPALTPVTYLHKLQTHTGFLRPFLPWHARMLAVLVPLHGYCLLVKPPIRPESAPFIGAALSRKYGIARPLHGSARALSQLLRSANGLRVGRAARPLLEHQLRWRSIFMSNGRG